MEPDHRDDANALILNIESVEGRTISPRKSVAGSLYFRLSKGVLPHLCSRFVKDPLRQA